MFIGMSAAPASQSIYGFVLMLMMKQAILSGGLSPVSGVAMGLFCGLAIFSSAVSKGGSAQQGSKPPSSNLLYMENAGLLLGLLNHLLSSHLYSPYFYSRQSHRNKKQSL